MDVDVYEWFSSQKHQYRSNPLKLQLFVEECFEMMKTKATHNMNIEDQTNNKISILRNKINSMSHHDRVCLVNDILRREGSFSTLFVYKEVNEEVEEAAQKTLDQWMKLKFQVVEDAFLERESYQE
ncbi:MAG: hypothetical protein ACPGDB_00750 [Fusobacterium sp.]